MPDKRHAAEVDAVIRALARDEHRAAALAVRLPVGERDLHRGVDRFGTRIGEEDVVEVARRQLRDAPRELELLRMAARERRDEIELAQAACRPRLRSRVRPWPALTQNRPDERRSACRRARSRGTCLPRARPSSGRALKSRFGVNGIQYSSSEVGGRRLSVTRRGWPIVVSWRNRRGGSYSGCLPFCPGG